MTLSPTLTPPLTNATGVVYDMRSFDFFELRRSSSSSAQTPVHYQSHSAPVSSKLDMQRTSIFCSVMSVVIVKVSKLEIKT